MPLSLFGSELKRSGKYDPVKPQVFKNVFFIHIFLSIQKLKQYTGRVPGVGSVGEGLSKERGSSSS